MNETLLEDIPRIFDGTQNICKKLHKHLVGIG